MRALQNILTRSLAARATAVKRVTENPGKKTAGVDQEVWSTPESKTEAVNRLKRYGYHPKPLRRVYIPKANGKQRGLSIPAMTDRAMQALHLLGLEPQAETRADRNSYGFRRERCPADAIGQCFIVLRLKTSVEWILEADIQSCFDEISHEWMLNNIPMDQGILRKWLKAGVIDKNGFHPTTRGTPQGSIISPCLANMVLDGLEKGLKQEFKPASQVHLIRFADDFIVTGKTKALLEQEIRPRIEEFLASRGLGLSPEKTRITHIGEGFDFLGQNIRKYGDKLLIKPSRKSIRAFYGKVQRIIQECAGDTTQTLIERLNPVLMGWANYHKHVVSKKVFTHLDGKIWYLLWQWARRRHPRKNTRWVKTKYFKRYWGRDWVFATEVTNQKGEQVTLLVPQLGRIPIRRHIKIKGEANPFDPDWEEYLESRSSWKMEQSLSGYRKVLFLWKLQKGKCPRCGQPITLETRWNIHHKVRRCDGGSNAYPNLILLHPNCHRQLHSQDSKAKAALSGQKQKEGVRDA